MITTKFQAPEDTKVLGEKRRGVEIANIFRKVTWHLSKFVKCLISKSLKCILLMLKRIGYPGKSLFQIWISGLPFNLMYNIDH